MESALIENCVKKCPLAQESLYNKFYPVILKIAFHLSKNESDAKDILQETFIKVFSNIHTFKHTGSLEGWIKRIARNTALAFLIKSKRTPASETFDLIPETRLATSDYTYNYTTGDFKAIINGLPEGYRSVIKLYMDGYSHKEIADILNISEGTSKSQVFHARKSLRTLI